MQAALKSLRKLQVLYRDKITFCQINIQKSAHRYTILEKPDSNMFLGIYNEEIFDSILAYHKDLYENATPEEVVANLEKMAKDMSGKSYY